jgi:hypothetical protein
MKKRLIITVAVGALHLTGKFFSAKSILFLALLCIPPTSLVLGLVFTLGLFAVTIWNIVGVFTMWRIHKAKALIPLALCIPFVFLGGIASDLGLHQRIRAFRDTLPKYEEKVASVVDQLHQRKEISDPQHNSNHFGRFPDNHGLFNVYAELDTNGVATIRFVEVISMNFHHRGYIYRADGDFKSALREREGIEAPINKNWCAIAD